MKNILFLIDGLPGGGAEKVVLTLASGLAERGNRVTLISLREKCDYQIPSSLRYHVVADTPPAGIAKLWHRLREIQRRAAALEQFLREKLGTSSSGAPFDLVFSHLPKTDRIIAATPSLQKAWFCLHESLLAGRIGTQKGWRRWRKKKQLQKLYEGRNIITVSQGIAHEFPLLNITPSHIKTIYNPIALEKVRKLAQEPSPYHDLPYLLHVGRFDPQKRHDRLLQAFAKTTFSGKLILLGKGSPQQEEKIRQIISTLNLQDRVILEGFVNNPYAYMREAQAVILSSDYEGLPNVLVETIACGTPVVSTNCPHGPSEILHGPLAQGLAELNPESLTEAIERTLAHPPLLEGKLLEELLSPFTLSQILATYESVEETASVNLNKDKRK